MGARNVTPQPPRPVRPVLLVVVAAAGFTLVAAAFWPQYLARPFAQVDCYTHAHAVAGGLWCLLLLAQVAAVRARRLALHRALGRGSLVLAPLFVLCSVLLAHQRFAALEPALLAQQAKDLYLPLVAAALFAVAWLLGFLCRRDRAAHRAFMLATALPLIDPVLGRVLFFYGPPMADDAIHAITFGLAAVLAGTLAWRAFPHARARLALAGYTLSLWVLLALWFVPVPAVVWRDLAQWFRALPLT
jgi:hypothetical protein